MRVPDLLWIVVIVGGLAWTSYTFIKDEIRLRRLRHSLTRMEKNPWDPLEIRQTLASDPELTRHLPAARRAELDQLVQRLPPQRDMAAAMQAKKAAFPDGLPKSGDVEDELFAHPERVKEMFKVMALLTERRHRATKRLGRSLRSCRTNTSRSCSAMPPPSP